MGIQDAAAAIYALRFGPPGPAAYRGALLLGAIAVSMRPELPRIVLDELDHD